MKTLWAVRLSCLQKTDISLIYYWLKFALVLTKSLNMSWHTEDRQIWVQQAQGTSVADAGDGRSPVYPLLQSEQVHAGSGTDRQVSLKGTGAGRTEKTATVERQEGGQEGPHYLQRSFATRSI